ncbi:MAG: hypothetical protein NEA02_06675 [Thermoanaerobaculia bacterium]|nr:hypothetical protein [Thermoanaerobaculia bacterium]
MSRSFAALVLPPLFATAAEAALPATPLPKATPLVTAAASAAAATEAPAFPAAWFDKNVIVTNKDGYVHVFWNAQEARGQLTGPDKRVLLARVARKLAAEKVKAGIDLVKMDVVFVRERDRYGMPRWDTLEKVAHLEFSREALLEGLKEGVVPEQAQMARLFVVFEVR